MKEMQTTSYLSEDGKIFNKKEDCELYEDFLNRRIECFLNRGDKAFLKYPNRELLKRTIDEVVVYIKATGVDTISHLIDFMQEMDDFFLIQSDVLGHYKDYVVLQWIENNTWVAISDTQIEFYKAL